MLNEESVRWMIIILSGYLLGSCLFCEWIPFLIHRKDIARESDDGCPGAANVFKHCGWRVGLLCLALDITKGFLPVFIGVKQFDAHNYLFSLLMLAPVLGHAWPIFHHFWGGKCIATSFGELIALFWVTPACLILAGLYIIFSTVAKITPNRKRSILVFSLFAVLSFGVEIFAERFSVALGCVLLSAVVIFKHSPFMQIKEQNAEMNVQNGSAKKETAK